MTGRGWGSLPFWLAVLLAVPARGGEAADGVARARELLSGGNYALAESELAQVLEQDSSSAEAHFLLGIVHTRRGEHRRAERRLKIALQLRPDSAPILNNLGVNALHLGREAEADRYFQRVLSLAANDGDALFNLGLIRLKQKRLANALDYLRRACRAQPGNPAPAQALLAAELESNSDQIDQALDRVVNLGSAEPRFYLQLAAQLAERGNAAAAVRVLARAHAVWSDSPEIAYRLALLQLRSGNLAAAREIVESAAVKARRAELFNLLGTVCERSGQYDKAVNAFRTAVELDPANEDYRFDLGYEFLVHRNLELAEKIFTASIARLPSGAKLRLGLSAVFFAQGQHQQAIQVLKEAIETAPDSPAAYAMLGRAFVLLSGDERIAATPWLGESLRKYMSLQPREALPYFVNALYSLRLGKDRAEAARLLEKCLHLDPEFAEAWLELGKLRNGEGQEGAALVALEKAAALKPDLPEVHYRLGRAYQKTGDREKARAAFAAHERHSKELKASVVQREKEIARFVYTLK
jgi:Tfp pilus assembly protein PilF